MKSVCTACLVVVICAKWALADTFDNFNHGVTALNRGDFSAAISFLGEALSAGDLATELKPVALVDRGTAYLDEEKYGEAIGDFDAALKLTPQLFEALSGRARALAISGNNSAALGDCQTMVKLWPYSEGVYEACGRVDWELGNYSHAASEFRTALTLNRRNPYSVLWYSLALLSSHSDWKNVDEFAHSVDFDNWPSPLIDLYLGKGSLERAERAVNAVDDPSRRDQACEVGFYGGEWQLLHGDVSGGRALLGQAADLCPKYFIEFEPAKSELKRLSNGTIQ